MKIIVTTDSTSDLSKDFQEKFNIASMPLSVNLGEDVFEDGVNLPINNIFEYVEKTGVLPKTGAKGMLAYKEFFENQITKNKADALVHISLSSELSSSYENAVYASQELKNVVIIDSRSLSSGSGLLALSACDKINEGKDLETIKTELENEAKQNVQASFIISNLKYLYKGGRCSAVAMFGANVLQIKPKIKLSDGKMCVDKKYIGKYETVVIKYVEELLKDFPTPNLKRAFITFTSEDTTLNQKLINLLKTRGFENIYTNFAGSTIASHCGQNCIGVLFLTR